MSASDPAVFLTAEWRWLVLLNYEVDPALLRSAFVAEGSPVVVRRPSLLD